MSRRRWTILALAGLLVGLEAAPGLGQVADFPVITGVFPPGATPGQAVEWTISGKNLAKVAKLRVSGGGVEVVGLTVKDDSTAVARVRVASDAELGTREVRLDGPSGLSNLAVVRVDRLSQVLEIEPNDEPEKAQTVEVGTALVGVLKALDLDHFRIKGTPGQRVTLDLEARRVGTSISPVLTVFDAVGGAIAQGREGRGGDRDCRMGVVIPPSGICLVQLRDNVYGGNDQARYRLRVDPAPYATALFPLGGPRNKPVEVELSGGNLPRPLRKSVKLPDAIGSFVDTGDFGGDAGPVICPARLVVGDGPELIEPAGGGTRPPIELASGQTINGRIDEAGQVDSYTIKVKAGDKVRVRVEAESLGSWLDSDVVLRDEKGATLAENDDSRASSAPDQSRVIGAGGVPELSPDSTIDYEAKADGTLTIELADRFGDGGPEYGYRLSAGPIRPDFSVTLLVGVNTPGLGTANQTRMTRTLPGQYGVFNLKPGGSTAVNFLVIPEGRPGWVEVRAEGLPEGVTADPVEVRLGSSDATSSNTTTAMPADAAASRDLLVLKVAPYVEPGLFEFRVVASPKNSKLGLTREATAAIGLDPASPPGRPMTRVVTRIPLRIVGDSRPMFVGPPAPPMLRGVRVPGPLLQGDRLGLALDFTTAITADDGSSVEARADGAGLSTSTVIPSGTSISDDAKAAGVSVSVLASARAQLGTHVVKVSFVSPAGQKTEREAIVVVKAPVEVRPLAERIFLNPGDDATFPVEVRREKGFEGEVEIKLEGLPRGVKVAKGVVLAPGTVKVDVRLEMAKEAKPLEKGSELRVVGMARMPRGMVSVDSKLRPMIQPRPADK